jgi:two-component system phosphate regulon sensor histidine kinase PhoR
MGWDYAASPNSPKPMTDPAPVLPAAARRPAIAITAASAAIAAPLLLAWFAGAHWLAASAAALLIAGLHAVWYVSARSRNAPPPGASPPMQPRPAGELAAPFREMLDRLADPVLLVEGSNEDDLNARRYLFANAAARDLLRIHRPAGPLTTAIRAPEVLGIVDDALFDAKAGDVMYESGGAQDRVWRARAAPLVDDRREGRLAVLILRDETEFRRSERTRADFLANASHELRTPLASLSGFIETLRGHARDDEKARERFLAIMHVQAERMRRLIDDLMSLSRIELGEHIPPASAVDLGLAVIDVLDALGPLANEGRVTFDTRLPRIGEAMVVGDRDQILQVVQNLVENALKYSPQGGVVSVQVDAHVDLATATAPATPFSGRLSLLTPDHSAGVRFAVLRVLDAGPGIRRSYLPRLTERFYRVEGQKTGELSGTGLGLAIVKHIINRHRGGLIVESDEGSGTTFVVYVPMLAPVPA